MKDFSVNVSKIVDAAVADTLAGFTRCTCGADTFGEIDHGKMAVKCARCGNWKGFDDLLRQCPSTS